MSERSNEPRKDGVSIKKRSLVLLLLLFLFIGVVFASAAIHFANRMEEDTSVPVLPPDVLPQVEERAVPTGEEDEEKLPQSKGGGSVNMTFSNQVVISLAEKEAALSFVSPARSNQSMVVELLIQDKLILRSGALTPGSQLEVLPLLENAVLQPGGYEGILRVSFYDADSGEKVNLNSVIPVEVTVVEKFEDDAG